MNGPEHPVGDMTLLIPDGTGPVIVAEELALFDGGDYEEPELPSQLQRWRT